MKKAVCNILTNVISTRNYTQLFQSQLVNKTWTLQMKHAVALSDARHYTQLCLINNCTHIHSVEHQLRNNKYHSILGS